MKELVMFRDEPSKLELTGTPTLAVESLMEVSVTYDFSNKDVLN